MAELTHYGSGTVPKSSDTRIFLLSKWLLAIQSALGGSAKAANNPTQADTVKLLETKIAKAKAGL